MFSNCIFCYSSLGANEVIEHFPIGTRLAYDPAKGRLWVVCAKCERWNLSPIEERWEALEEAERAYRSTSKRAATDNIGLARLADGTDLIRIGSPLRPEFAAWRYGDQFGKRRRRAVLATSALLGGFAGMAGLALTGRLTGLAVGGAGILGVNVATYGFSVYQNFKARVWVPNMQRQLLPVTTTDLLVTRLGVKGATCIPQVEFQHRAWIPTGRVTRSMGIERRPALKPKLTTVVEGDIALEAMTKLLPMLNGAGGSSRHVSLAVSAVEESTDFNALLRKAVFSKPPPDWGYGSSDRAREIPAPLRLALEMSLHEDDERRALEGELALLEQRWKDAEEIAAIADGLLSPPASGST